MRNYHTTAPAVIPDSAAATGSSSESISSPAIIQPEIKLPPLVPFKPRVQPPPIDPESTKCTQHAFVIEPIIYPPSLMEVPITSFDKNPLPNPLESLVLPGTDRAPVVAAGLLNSWSGEAKPIPAAEPSEKLHSTDRAATPMHPIEPTIGYKVYSFLAPTEKPGFMGALGRFRIREAIGEGGMGYVFLAEDKYLKRPVALKVMKPHLARRKSCWRWFLDESRATAALQSDRIPTIYEIGEHRGTLYMAMELLWGESLDTRLKRSPIPLPMALWIAREAALGLALVHRLQIYHRDVKPANLWLGVPRDLQEGSEVIRTYAERKAWRLFKDHEYQHLKVLDFGLARLTKGAKARQKHGQVIGTPAYMAPEQARGELGDGRADLFSLGVVLYQMLAGRLPFRGENPLEIATAIISETPTPLAEINPHLPRPLIELVENMLAKDSAYRPDNALEVAEIIKRCEQILSAPPATPADSKPLSKSSFLRRMVGG
jgi:hypothetical protein